ncbi:MAG: HlyD family efflux transporter periplasmic adaptor subunit [Candidatus Yonathbacteria bacterium]|nr:HlyD family efflux transporter periplasmic adaptor subunit [Candidatus Yonathbacteria bacterium]NTW47810.1 HlyD family efflux transporter periplasmic adaptor subunit [Candidatus Yonathbacteria bacterium]
MNISFSHIKKTTISFISAHKILVSIVGILLCFVIGFLIWKSTTTNEKPSIPTTDTVTSTTFEKTVSGSGQVAAERDIEIHAETSGAVVSVSAKKGQYITKGAVIATLDGKDAAKTLRDAKIALESAQLSYDKLMAAADDVDVLKATNALSDAQDEKRDAEESITEGYEDGFNDVADAFLDMPDVIEGLQDILFSDDIAGNGQWNIDYYASVAGQYDTRAASFADDAYDAYTKAKTAYDAAFTAYKNASRYSDKETIASLMNETYTAMKLTSDAVKSMNDLIQLYRDELSERDLSIDSLSATHLSSLSSHTGTTNNHITSLLSSIRSIENNEKALIVAERAIIEKQADLNDITAGADSYDIRSQELSLLQKKNALADAQASYADMFIIAPVSGTLASLDIVVGDSVSSNASIGNIIGEGLMATISLNEVDVEGVDVGDSVRITFDAVSDLSIVGTVAEVDVLGTVSQGVVTYDVDIVFETDDTRIKPGMTLTAEIITESISPALVISNEAVQTKDGISSVMLITEGIPTQTPVTIGPSNDTVTVIMEGLVVGDTVISSSSTRTTSSSEVENAMPSGGGMGIPGMGPGMR